MRQNVHYFVRIHRPKIVVLNCIKVRFLHARAVKATTRTVTIHRSRFTRFPTYRSSWKQKKTSVWLISYCG